ncbi:amidohydrolase [Roseomonas sp. CECT 9278]|uniref:amidohydrolase n=1 Tax=Roseomonas sp. CECT 9278 TaxID=2845823 RepID=UPI001E2F44C7|nr:amidohydrolase [Roseomonas sp. CECT 9278]CAH0183473.1 N-substituted formamide deformylase [Roseomonas sp. CECT 9278]
MNADFVLLDGRVATMDAAGTEVAALAALGGRIVALGSSDAMREHIGPATRVLNAQGRRVIPGIVDSHAHPDSYAVRLRTWTLVSPDRVASRSELLATINRVCSALPPGRWGAFYRLNERASGGYPTLDELDSASAGHPVFILRTDGHLGLANRAAFAACGVAADAPDPPFGAFDRDPATRTFTGLVRETAAHVFLNAVHGADSEADIAEGMEMVQDECLRHGITSVANSLTPSKAIRAYQDMHRDRRWRMRMGIIASGRDEPLIPHLIGAGIRSGFGDEWLRLVGVEWCPDCSTSGRTAAYWEPYRGAAVPGEPVPNTGMLLHDRDDLTQRATAAHKAGLQVMIEGVGDRGIDFALDVMEAALAAHPVADHRMRVEHCCYVTPPILDRLKRGGFVDSSATGFMDELGEAYVANRGQDAMRHMWPHRSLIAAGIPAPGHSDFAVCRVNPFTAIGAMVTRRSQTGADLDAREAVTPHQALAAYTTLGAWAQREEHEKGSLEVGKLADLAVLDTDILGGDAAAIRDTRVVATVVGGVLRHGG